LMAKERSCASRVCASTSNSLTSWTSTAFSDAGRRDEHTEAKRGDDCRTPARRDIYNRTKVVYAKDRPPKAISPGTNTQRQREGMIAEHQPGGIYITGRRWHTHKDRPPKAMSPREAAKLVRIQGQRSGRKRPREQSRPCCKFDHQ
jgi:hypothetical protein